MKSWFEKRTGLVFLILQAQLTPNLLASTDHKRMTSQKARAFLKFWLDLAALLDSIIVSYMMTRLATERIRNDYAAVVHRLLQVHFSTSSETSWYPSRIMSTCLRLLGTNSTLELRRRVREPSLKRVPPNAQRVTGTNLECPQHSSNDTPLCSPSQMHTNTDTSPCSMPTEVFTSIVRCQFGIAQEPVGIV